MFQLIERMGERKAVYSKSDLAYMIGRGWAPVSAVQEPKPEPKIEAPKRAYKKRK